MLGIIGAIIGWFVVGMVVGAVLVTAIDRFWDSIAGWLNNTAADAVEKVFGYNARKNMLRAVAAVSKLRDHLHNKTVVYTKKDPLDANIQKVTLKSVAPVYEQEEEVIESFENTNRQVKALEYRG